MLRRVIYGNESVYYICLSFFIPADFGPSFGPPLFCLLSLISRDTKVRGWRRVKQIDTAVFPEVPLTDAWTDWSRVPLPVSPATDVHGLRHLWRELAEPVAREGRFVTTERVGRH